jgi:hypothetical protein
MGSPIEVVMGSTVTSLSPLFTAAVRRRRGRQRYHVRLIMLATTLFAMATCILLLFWKQQQRRQMQDSSSSVVLNSNATNSTESKFFTTSEYAPSCDALIPDDINYTLVTQLSQDRLWMMEHHCQRWGVDHPISIAVLTNQTMTQVTSTLTDLGCSSDFVQVQVLLDSLEDYPVNRLRNMALRNVQTSHVVYVDIDFWPSTNVYTVLDSDLVRQALSDDYQTALVLPAFQLQRQCKEWRECPEHNIPRMPTTRAELFSRMLERHAYQFDPTNRGGHGSTRYKEWLTQKETVLLPIPCVHSHRYEPYLVFRYCRDVPPFQEAFAGYGKNKVTWVMQLIRSGWKLFQVGHAFVVHYPHLESPSRTIWNGGQAGVMVERPHGPDVNLSHFKRGQIDQTFVEFRSWLQDHVPDQTVIPLCDKAADDDSKLWVNK